MQNPDAGKASGSLSQDHGKTKSTLKPERSGLWIRLWRALDGMQRHRWQRDYLDHCMMGSAARSGRSAHRWFRRLLATPLISWAARFEDLK